METRIKYLAYLLTTALVATLGVALAFRPTPSLLTRNVTTASETSATANSQVAVTLSVGDGHHTASVPEGSTVIELMLSLSPELEFTGHDYPALGFFVESINGKKNGDGYYWFLYVNGASSNTGASQTALTAGDAVEWIYKKGD